MREPYAPSAADEARKGEGSSAVSATPVATGPRGRRWVRWLAKRLALVLFGLCIALLLGEVLVRIFGHEGPVYTFRDPVIGRRYTRSWEGDVWNEEAGRVVHVRFNREGMRDRDWPEERAENKRRVAFLGDSMVAAVGVDEALTFPKRLEALSSSQHAAEVMNWGVQGSSPALESILFEERVRRYRPDLVFCVYFTGNDFSDDWQPIGGRRQGWGEVRPDGSLAHEPFDGSDFSFNEWLARSSRLYVWQKRILSRLRDDEGGVRPGLRIFDRSNDPELERAWQFEEQVLRRIHRLVAATSPPGVIPVMVLLVLPCADEIYDDLWEAAVARGQERGWRLDRGHASERLAGICRSAKIMMHDLTPAMRAAAGSRRSTNAADWLYQRGTGHLNERGHEVVARELGSGPKMETPR